jgi:hypothetical protein
MASRFRSQSGVTLIEALVAILVGVIALLGLYQLVDASNKLTKQQTEVADVQQSSRIGISELSRIIRQSRVGGLYFGNSVLPGNKPLPTGNNSPGGESLQDLSGASHFIRKGTDVIEVRGVISGDRYILDEGNVTLCGANCYTANPVQVTIPWQAALGFVNFPMGQAPSLASRSGSFYFVVQNGENQGVRVSGSTYLVPVYIAGLVTATGGPCLTTPTWCTLTSTTFTFTMNPTNVGARELNATTPASTTTLAKSIAGGAIDVVRFFVDEGLTNATGSSADTHPSLAEAVLDPSTGGPTTGRWNIQPLVEEVEDFQIAYGVDGIDGSLHDGGVSPVAVDETGTNRDEWVGNFANEVETYLPISAADAFHSGVDAFVDTSIPAGPSNPLPAVPALRSVWISLVVKSTDPELDPHWNGPGARGIQILDSRQVLDRTTFSAATGRPYRRRPLSLAVSLRNNTLFNLPAPTPTP